MIPTIITIKVGIANTFMYQLLLRLNNPNPSLPLASDPTAPHLLSFNTLIHMITIKLSSSNYLLWKSQLFPLLKSQDLLGHADGTFLPPPPYDPTHSHTSNDKHLAWNAAN